MVELHYHPGEFLNAMKPESSERNEFMWIGLEGLDELIVIDSDSEDDTRDIAQAEGATVLRHSEILPRYGSYRGKGEALWKSLYETHGDLVAWSDTDIVDWHPQDVPVPTQPAAEVAGYGGLARVP